jgi:RNA polymerase sigma factor (sigma-70 family)
MSGRGLVVDDEEAIVEGLMHLLEAAKSESSGACDRLSADVTDLLAEMERLAGEQESLDLEQLYLGLRRLLYSIPRKRYGLTADDAEDVVQQAWLLFLEKRDLIRTARLWLCGTVSNLCKRQVHLLRHRRKTFTGSDSLADLPDTRVDPVDGAIPLREALACLDQQSRTLCQLIAIEGYAYDAASAALGVPVGSIGPMYMRAKSKMRLRMAA